MGNQRSQILAIVTTNTQDVVSGSVPIFFAREEEERDRLAKYISRVPDAATYDLENGTYIIVG